jgi:hypothetical protein
MERAPSGDTSLIAVMDDETTWRAACWRSADARASVRLRAGCQVLPVGRRHAPNPLDTARGRQVARGSPGDGDTNSAPSS